MEENQDLSLFELTIDLSAKAHLSETARWAKFLAIVGFVMIGIFLLFAIFAGSLGFLLTSNLKGGDVMRSGVGASFQFILMALFGLIYFFPCLFTLRFANKMKTALAGNDQETLNESFRNIKKTFRFVGILTIIILAIYAIILITAILAYGFAS